MPKQPKLTYHFHQYPCNHAPHFNQYPPFSDVKTNNRRPLRE